MKLGLVSLSVDILSRAVNLADIDQRVQFFCISEPPAGLDPDAEWLWQPISRILAIDTRPDSRSVDFGCMKPHGPWNIKSSQDIYADSYVQLRLDQVVRPDGGDGQHVVVGMKPGVCVLPIDRDDHVILTREFHYGIGRMSDEGVSGGIEPGEDPAETARRELQEELGLAAAELEWFSTVDPFTTIVVSPTRLYFARDLTRVEASPEGTELIESVRMPLEDAKSAVLNGRITHGPTCILILAATMAR